MQQPNFFIVGAPKCGTTSLSEYLRTHPRIFVSDPKEPSFFCGDLPGIRQVTTLDAYLDLFRSAGSTDLAVGEASALSLYSRVAIRRIREFNCDSRIIVMLRNPLEMIPSYHSQQLFVMNEDQPELARAWELQEYRAAGEREPRFCRAAGVLQYRSVGLLGAQVERLLAIFPREQVLFVLFDDLKASSASVCETVLRFLRVPDHQQHEFPRLNQNKVLRSRMLESLRRAASAHHPRVYRMATQSMRRLGLTPSLKSRWRMTRRREPLNAEMRDRLRVAFAADVQLLASLINRDLGHWMSGAAAA